MLTRQAPMISFKHHRVLYWSSADQILGFTTKDDVANHTARVALDETAPRVVEIAGDRPGHGLRHRQYPDTTDGKPFKLQWAGTKGTLSVVGKIARRGFEGFRRPVPAWQGMQYFVSMFSGRAQLRHVTNDRSGHCPWTTVRDVLAAHLKR